MNLDFICPNARNEEEKVDKEDLSSAKDRIKMLGCTTVDPIKGLKYADALNHLIKCNCFLYECPFKCYDINCDHPLSIKETSLVEMKKHIDECPY